MITIKNLNYKIGRHSILEDINLTIQQGEFVAILGPNGAGKTTLLKLIIGEISNYQGSIEINGVNNQEWLKKNRIGYLPQKEFFDLDFPATALDIVLMGIVSQKGLFKTFNKKERAKGIEYLNLVGLKNKEHQYISSLSGGEYQRVLLARALMTESNLIFLDEPEANIDRNTVTDFFELLKDLNQQGKTIIVVSHDINVMTKYCTFLICLNKTLHFHDRTELFNADVVRRSYGDSVQLIEKDY
ncbi:MAG: metal ABC transporter ATP-binding protein [Candidatus Cloacimonas sp.]|nr:metal ABC transporter ATP-binding protein [Candidatus Cloacimonadota bacterium]